MKEIKILMINQIYDELITDASIDEIKYTDEMRIKDVILLCEKNKNFQNFEYYDKYLDYPFEKYLRAKISLDKGQIDWDLNMNDLLVSKAVEFLENNFLVIRSHGGIGSGEEIIVGYLIGKVIDIVIKLVRKLFLTYREAIKIIEEHTKYDIEYINDVIRVNDTWPCGFISSKDFKNKLKVEKKIMKKLGYKLKDGIWIKVDKRSFLQLIGKSI